VAGVNKVLCFT